MKSRKIFYHPEFQLPVQNPCKNIVPYNIQQNMKNLHHKKKNDSCPIPAYFGTDQISVGINDKRDEKITWPLGSDSLKSVIRFIK